MFLIFIIIIQSRSHAPLKWATLNSEVAPPLKIGTNQISFPTLFTQQN